jgi:hypothetical protein
MLRRQHNPARLPSLNTGQRMTRTFSPAENFLRVPRRIVRTAACTLTYFSALLPPGSSHQGREVCLSKRLPMSHLV